MFDHGFPSDWSTIKKLIWLKGAGIIGGASAIWKTVTGSLIHITDALASPMQKCEVSLEPIQDLHGQDAPYPAGGGKNKINYLDSGDIFIATSATIRMRTNADVTISISNDTVTMTRTSSSYGLVFLARNLLANTQYCFSSIGNEDSEYYVGKVTWINTNQFSSERIASGTNIFTTTDAGDYDILIWRTGQANITAKDCQLELGSSATPYKPYENICPITGWTGCEVWVKDEYDTSLPSTASVTFPALGKNLLNVDELALRNSTATNLRNCFYFTGTGTYTVSASATISSTISARVKSASGTYGTSTAITNSSGYTSATYTLSEGETLIVFEAEDKTLAYSKEEFLTAKIQLEEGSSASSYEPYTNTVYGGKCDFVSGKVPVTWREIVFDGVINKVSVASSSYIGATTTRGYKTSFATNAKSPVNAMCNCAKWQGNTTEQGYQGFYFNPNNAETTIRLLNSETGITSEDTASTATAKMNAYLREHPLTIVYELATPEEISFTPQTISTLKDENNVWSNTNGDITLIYKAQAE